MNPPDSRFPPNDAIESAAAEWLVRHDRGLTPAQQDEFLSWLTASAAHRESFERHRGLWGDFNALKQWRPAHSATPNPDLLARHHRPARWRRPLPLLFATAAAAGPRKCSVADESGCGWRAQCDQVADRRVYSTYGLAPRLSSGWRHLRPLTKRPGARRLGWRHSPLRGHGALMPRASSHRGSRHGGRPLSRRWRCQAPSWAPSPCRPRRRVPRRRAPARRRRRRPPRRARSHRRRRPGGGR